MYLAVFLSITDREVSYDDIVLIFFYLILFIIMLISTFWFENSG